MGGYVQYDGADNNFILGVHALNNTTLSDDNPVIIIPRDTGKVGIGTTTPNEKLTVSGNISACGDIRTKCGTIEGKVIYARNCFAGTKFTAQYISNFGEACIMSGCHGCVTLGSSLGTKGVVISANNVLSLIHI